MTITTGITAVSTVRLIMWTGRHITPGTACNPDTPNPYSGI